MINPPPSPAALNISLKIHSMSACQDAQQTVHDTPINKYVAVADSIVIKAVQCRDGSKIIHLNVNAVTPNTLIVVVGFSSIAIIMMLVSDIMFQDVFDWMKV